uniref:Ribonuclease H-like domain-containing protein n=1 Tax=Tanacetum cinerariifolium TaxID=118510 RepID=A0A6L2JDN0_TANCI|nr:ribonuclease H-like domain-containing protein [Tanacetum cinerariifolium]
MESLESWIPIVVGVRLFKLQQVWTLVDLPYGKRAIGTKWVYRNKKDKRGIVVRNKARLAAQGHTQEDRIDYDKIEKEVYVCQPPGFGDLEFPDKVYKVEKALYGLHQALRALMIGMGWQYNLDEIGVYTAVFIDEYDTPSHTKKVFANIRKKGTDFSGIVTPLFPSMLESKAVEGKGLRQPTKPQHTPTTALPSHVEPIHTVSSSSHPKKTQKRRKAKSKVIEIPQSSEPTNLDVDEAIHKERGDSVERAVTTAASLDAEQDNGTINRTQSMAIPIVHYPQEFSSGGRPRRQESMGDRPA